MTDLIAGQDERDALMRCRVPGPARHLVAIAALVVAATGPPLAAQAVIPTKDAMRLPAPPTMEVPARGARVAPAISLGTPSGFGAEWRDAMLGFGFQATTRLHNRPDGVGAAAIGLGNAREYVGLEVAVASYGTARSCCRGGMSFKLHHTFPWDLGLAVGWENGAVWGPIHPDAGEETDAGSSVYGVASKVFLFRGRLANPYRALTLSAGVGNGRFRTEKDIIADKETVNVFGSAAYRVNRPISLVVDWTGQDLGAGISFLPIRDRAFVVMPGVVDLTTKPRVVLGAALGFDYGSLFH